MSDDVLNLDFSLDGMEPKRPPVLAAPTPKPIRPIGNTTIPAETGPRCPQCGHVKPLVHTRTVYVNRRQEQMTFCSDACGNNYQMGCEG